MEPNAVFFLKEIVSNQIIIKGRKVAFENIGSNRGVLELNESKSDDKEFIAGLNDLANRRVGGVVKLFAAEYAQKKSQPILNPSVRPRDMLRARRPLPPARKTVPQPIETQVATPKVAVPAVDLKTMGLADDPEPPATFRPTTRRISRKAKAEPEAP